MLDRVSCVSQFETTWGMEAREEGGREDERERGWENGREAGREGGRG